MRFLRGWMRHGAEVRRGGPPGQRGLPASGAVRGSRTARCGARSARAGTRARRARGGGRRSPAGRPSLAKMLVTCFSTLRSVISSRSAIAWLERPSAISSSTSRSRGVSASSGPSSRARRRAAARRPAGRAPSRPAATRRERVDEVVEVGDAVLEQVAEPLGALGEQLRRDARRRRAGRGQRCRRRGCRARISCAARRPSSVWVGGIRMSTIATSGSCCVDLAQQLVGVAGLGRRPRARPRRAAARCPRGRAALSSAITTRTAAPRVTTRPAARGARDAQAARRAPRRGRRARAGRSRAPASAPPMPSSAISTHARRRPRADARRVAAVACGVLGDVGQRLGRRRSRRRARPARAAGSAARRRQLVGTGERARERLERGVEPVVEHRRMDAARELAQLLRATRASSSLARRASSSAVDGSSRIRFCEEPQLQRDRDEPLLRAVVQVALEPPALGVAGRRRCARARPAARRGGRCGSACRRSFSSAIAGRGGDGLDELRVVVERGVVDERGDLAPVALDRHDAPVAAAVGSVTGAPSRRRRTVRPGTR